jgi:hypothetical protein
MKKIPDIEVAKKMINLQQSATARGIEFDLSFETVKMLMTRTNCFYTGAKFEEEGANQLSVDRVDSKRGYIEGNVVACTVGINSKKANLTIEEIQQLSSKITEFIGKTNKKKPTKNEKTNVDSDIIVDDIVVQG